MSRFKICTYELGDGSLTGNERHRIRRALEAEAERIRNTPLQIDFAQRESASAQEAIR